jgi:hypothetical protein
MSMREIDTRHYTASDFAVAVWQLGDVACYASCLIKSQSHGEGKGYG